MMDKLLCFIVLMLGIVNTSAQSMDSKQLLLHILKSGIKKDTALVQLYVDIGDEYMGSQPDSAVYYYFQAQNLSKKISYAIGEFKFYTGYSELLMNQGKIDSSLLLNKQALALAREIKTGKYLAAANFNIGNSYTYLEKYDSAIYYYLQALPWAENTGNENYLGVMYNSLSMVYEKLDNYDKSLAYSIKAEQLARKNNNPRNLYYALANKSAPLIDLNRLDEAEKAVTEALAISKSAGDEHAYAANLMNMFTIKFRQKKYAELKKYADEALPLFEKYGDIDGVLLAKKSLALYYLNTKNFARAKEYAQQALGIAQDEKLLTHQNKLFNLLADISYSLQAPGTAETYLAKADSIKTILDRETTAKTIENLTTKYKTEKKEAQIKLQQAQLRQKSNLIYFLVTGAIALLAISLLTYRNYRHQHKLQQAKISGFETEKQLTATEAVLKGEEQERTRLAKDLHDGLGGMLSGIKYSLSNMKENLIMTPDNAQAFNRSIDMLDSSIQEMRRVAHNMMPEVLVKYGLSTALREYCNEIESSGVIHAHYQFVGREDAGLEQTTAIAVYRVVQELVNNAIKHAAASNVLVQLHIFETEKQLTVTVEDDGKGFDTAILNKATGIGWRNINNRVEFLQGKVDIASVPGNGTSVLIEMSI